MGRRLFAPPVRAKRSRGWTPPVDVEETGEAWIFEVELPGARQDDVVVEVGDEELAISGEIKKRERVGVIRRRGRHIGNFHYHSALPPGVNAYRVEAQYGNGVLTVSVPRPEHA